MATDEDGAILGFLGGGPPRDEDIEPDGRAEIYTLYVDPAAWRRGAGTALVQASLAEWEPLGLREVVLWAFEENDAGRAFYERLGFHPDGARKLDDFGGAHPVELRYRRSVG